MLHRQFLNLSNIFKTIALTILLSSTSTMAAPIDWHGQISFDSNLIHSFRRVSKTTTGPNSGGQLPNTAPGNYEDASYQSYIVRLAPQMIINDSVTFFGEMTTGHAYGGFLGDSAQINKPNNNFGDALYMHNFNSNTANVTLTKFYVELYSDTGTYIVGRHPFQWGLGAIYNNGDNLWDRFSTIRDGITAKFKIGNINLIPYYAKVSSLTSLTNADDTKSIGLAVLYQNIDRDLELGILFGKKNSDTQNSTYTSGTTKKPIGAANVKVTDLFLNKSFGDFNFRAEVPIFQGSISNVYTTGIEDKYKSLGIVTESKYSFNDHWSLKLHLGHLTGDDGKNGSFQAMYLHPNYNIANLMFRYNVKGVSDSTKSIHDNYMVNTKYLRLSAIYESENWKFDTGFILAKANETAKAGQLAYDHQSGTSFTAVQDQSDDLGHEIDFSASYFWNPNVTIQANLGYHFVGKYFTYNNGSVPVEKTNTYLASIGLGILF